MGSLESTLNPVATLAIFSIEYIVILKIFYYIICRVYLRKGLVYINYRLDWLDPDLLATGKKFFLVTGSVVQFEHN